MQRIEKTHETYTSHPNTEKKKEDQYLYFNDSCGRRLFNSECVCWL